MSDTISSLKKHPLNPVRWHVYKGDDHDNWFILFEWSNYSGPSLVYTQRKKVRMYRSLDSAVKDVFSCDDSADVRIYSSYQDCYRAMNPVSAYESSSD